MAQEQGDVAPGKVCPDCAETVQSAARVCKHCGFRFDDAAEARPSASSPNRPPEKSTVGAVLLGLVLAGLGHFYIGEVRRGAVLLAGQIVLVVGGLVAYAAGFDGAWGGGLVVAVISAIDAYAGAQYRAEHRRPRPVTGGLWAYLAICLVLVSVAIAVGASDSEGPEQASEEDCLILANGNELCGAEAVTYCEQFVGEGSMIQDLATCRQLGANVPQTAEERRATQQAEEDRRLDEAARRIEGEEQAGQPIEKALRDVMGDQADQLDQVTVDAAFVRVDTNYYDSDDYVEPEGDVLDRMCRRAQELAPDKIVLIYDLDTRGVDSLEEAESDEPAKECS